MPNRHATKGASFAFIIVFFTGVLRIMRGRLHPLPLALCAGVAAVAAAALPLIVTGAQQQVRVTVTSRADLPRILCMFGGCKSESTTTTTSDSRQRVDNSNGTSQIIQCDLKRVIHLDNNAKTYYTVTFDQAKAAMQAMMSRATASALHGTTATAPPIHGSGGLTFTANTVNDPQTQTMFGMTAHHVVETFTATSTGTGDCPSGTMSMTNDEWYVPKIVRFSCPLPRPQMPAMPRGGGTAGGVNPCFGRFQVEASGKAASTDRMALKQTSTMDMGGFKLTTHEDVTQFQVMPYDPSFFAPPPGYTQVSPPPTGF